MSFNTNGLDSLILDMDEICDIPDDTMWAMLDAGGAVIENAHKEELETRFSSHTGKLHLSPKARRKQRGGQKYILIYPKGEHHTYTPKTGNGVASNQEVGFVLEFGGHGNVPTEWMRDANEKHADEAVEAEFKPFDDWHKKHNL